MGNLDRVLRIIEREGNNTEWKDKLSYNQLVKIIIKELGVKEKSAHNYIRRLVEDKAICKYQLVGEDFDGKVYHSRDEPSFAYVNNPITPEEIDQGLLHPCHYGYL